ncbi:hypothetical protein GCM10010331_32440 [Streptomyces xanthochromogenes]|uniref:Uncharacterized protein n=1 Tax=Streptomyces xanthochromogenes TaxID=67384 RepID=A0ABQ3A008_9ACTN|nr:hypothetical protein GCM10010326_23270 [Streptomyces xanthochromogenes]GHB42550.1 hypothetical protein GCM10010331_32440 [Streptomyces xanthochromogenes]
MPPLALTQRANAFAMAGMPGALVAEVPSGAQVMTVMGSLEPPATPGRTPQPVNRLAPTAEHAANTVAVVLIELIERRGRVEPRGRCPP